MRAGFPAHSLTWGELEAYMNMTAASTATRESEQLADVYLQIRNHLLWRWKLDPAHYLSYASLYRAESKQHVPSYIEQHAGCVLRVFEYLMRNGFINVGVFNDDLRAQEDPIDLTATQAADGTYGIHERKSRDRLTAVTARPLRVLVIGAGAAGLAVARQLTTLGNGKDYHVTILEARDRLGGRVWTETTALHGTPIDLGASIITGLIGNPLDDLHAQMQCETRVIGETARLLSRDGSVSGAELEEQDSKMDKLFNELLEQVSRHKHKHAADKSLGDELNRLRPSLTPLARAVLDWYYANLEYACATDLSALGVREWDQDDPYEFEGEHLMCCWGYATLIAKLGNRLDIVYNTAVTRVEYSEDGVTCHVTRDGQHAEQLQCDICVVTVPLGVLKKNCIQFVPPLPDWKSEAIAKLGFGLLNKVGILFEEIFWERDLDWFGVVNSNLPSERRGEYYLFWNMYKFTGKPMLMALVAGHASQLHESRDDAVILRDVLELLTRNFGKDNPALIRVIKSPLSHVITHWGTDRWAYGSYSYIAVGATGNDYDALARPVWLGGVPRLFWAGEATNRLHPATVAGAYQSGLREAEQIHRHFHPPRYYSAAPLRNIPTDVEPNHHMESCDEFFAQISGHEPRHEHVAERSKRRGIVKFRHRPRDTQFKYEMQFQVKTETSANTAHVTEDRYRNYGSIFSFSPKKPRDARPITSPRSDTRPDRPRYDDRPKYSNSRSLLNRSRDSDSDRSRSNYSNNRSHRSESSTNRGTSDRRSVNETAVNTTDTLPRRSDDLNRAVKQNSLPHVSTPVKNGNGRAQEDDTQRKKYRDDVAAVVTSLLSPYYKRQIATKEEFKEQARKFTHNIVDSDLQSGDELVLTEQKRAKIKEMLQQFFENTRQ